MLAMRNIISLLIFITIFSSSCVDLRMFCGGSFCLTRNYDFSISSLDLVKQIKEIKSKDKHYDVVRYNDSIKAFLSIDSYDTITYNTNGNPHRIDYDFNVYDSIRKCIVACTINLGESGDGFDEGTIHVYAFAFPEFVNHSDYGLYIGDSLSYIKYRLVGYDIRKETDEQTVIIESIESFFKEIGRFEISY